MSKLDGKKWKLKQKCLAARDEGDFGEKVGQKEKAAPVAESGFFK